jgi:hypothetical protein
MADNVNITPGSGVVVGTDEVTDGTLGTVQIQYVKIMDGTLNGTNKLSVNSSGQVATSVNDGTGSAINSLSAGSGANGLLVALGATNFVVSTNNSSTAQLAASATFTGVVESIFNEQDISILLTTDQPGTLTINQYIDSGATRKSNSWVYTIAAGVPFSRSFTGNGNYFNLVFQNTGASTTTTLNINTAYGILESVTNLGNSPVSLNEINGVAIDTSIPVGGIAATVNPSASTNGTVTTLMTDKVGRLVTVGSHVRALTGAQGTTITSSTSAITVLNAIASTYCDITSLTVTNGSATPTAVTLSDGTNSYVFNAGAGSGFTIPFGTPLPATSINTAWTLTCGTSVASIYVTIVYVKNI